MLSRAALRVNALPRLKNVDDQRRERQALTLKARRQAPFAAAAVHMGWSEKWAVAWSWDAQKAAAQLADAGLDAQGVKVWPETALHAPPAPGGARLVSVGEGFDGQVWREGALVASRFWPRRPSDEDWGVFLRSAGLGPAPSPEPVAPALSDRPWGGRGAFADLLDEIRQAPAKRAAVIAAFALTAPIAWRVGETLRLNAAAAALEAQVDNAGAEVSARVRDRRAALRQQGLLEAEARIARHPHQADLLVRVLDAVPQGADLRSWRFRGGRLETTLVWPQTVDMVGLVQTLEGLEGVTDVNAERSRQAGAVDIRARLPAAEEGLRPADPGTSS